MLKKIFLITILFFLIILPNKLFPASIKDAEKRIQTIETYKMILASGNSNYVWEAEEKAAIKSMIDELENDVYIISTKDNSLKINIEEYDIDKTLWPINLSGSYFENKVKINENISLLYSTLMERRYVPENKMADYQRRDYEYYITDYETKIRSGIDVFYAELHFKIQKWNNPSQYRFVPEKIVLYKIAKQDRIIETIKNLSPIIWSYSPEIEYRTKKEIDADLQKTKRILYAESRQSSEEETQKETKENDNGRRTIYFALETFKNKIKNPNSPTISKIQLNSFDTALTFGIGNYVFAGLELCFDLNEQTKNTIYSFGGLLGGNIKLFNFIQPFIQSGIAVRTDDRTVFKIGSGIDVIVGHILITSTYNYIWSNSFSSEKSNATDRENKRYHSASIGVGLTW